MYVLFFALILFLSRKHPADFSPGGYGRVGGNGTSHNLQANKHSPSSCFVINTTKESFYCPTRRAHVVRICRHFESMEKGGGGGRGFRKAITEKNIECAEEVKHTFFNRVGSLFKFVILV